MKARTFVDTVRLHAKAGDGGDGAASFRHEKFVPFGGPDGGDGGRGGDIALVGDEDVDSLVAIWHEPERRAGNGGRGMGRYRHGADGSSVRIPVPLGTVVKDEQTGRELGEIVRHGDTMIVAKGGAGGAGNVHFKSSTNQAPTRFTEGKPGEEAFLRLDLKLLADVGLVGFPSAGKSSLLRAVTAAHPKVAAYPFTTLRPIIGTVVLPDEFASFRIADIPGIVEGAHDGIGLGDAFLRHIERSAVLVFVIDMAGVDGRKPWDDFETLLSELRARDPALLERPRIVAANKMDLEQARENLPLFAERTGVNAVEICAADGSGLDALVQKLVALVKPRPTGAGREGGATIQTAAAGAAPARKAAARRRPAGEAAKARHEKTGRESTPGHTPPRPIEGRGEAPGAVDVVSGDVVARLGTFLRR
ncbi:MAG: GTPase ObgE [Kiritimatiellae bacterium]|nr:GTPase ObgE [Kiritimatiellia bacterium]